MGIRQELTRYGERIVRSVRELPPFKDKRSPQEILLDNRLAETDRFLKEHEKYVNSLCVTPEERRLFRAAFAFTTIPDIQYPFTNAPDDPWRTPSEQLDRIRQTTCARYGFNQTDQRVQQYLSTIEELGRNAALLAQENPSILNQYLEEAPTFMTIARSMAAESQRSRNESFS